MKATHDYDHIDEVALLMWTIDKERGLNIMLPETVRARHPRPKPNETICCTFERHRGLEYTIVLNFYFLKWAMTYDRSLTIGGVLRFSGRFWARVARPYDVWIIR